MPIIKRIWQPRTESRPCKWILVQGCDLARPWWWWANRTCHTMQGMGEGRGGKWWPVGALAAILPQRLCSENLLAHAIRKAKIKQAKHVRVPVFAEAAQLFFGAVHVLFGAIFFIWEGKRKKCISRWHTICATSHISKTQLDVCVVRVCVGGQ